MLAGGDGDLVELAVVGGLQLAGPGRAVGQGGEGGGGVGGDRIVVAARGGADHDVVGAGLGGGDLDRLVGVGQVAGIVVDEGGGQGAEPDVEVVGVGVVDRGVEDDDQVLAGGDGDLVELAVVGGLQLAGPGRAVGQGGEGGGGVGGDRVVVAARGGADHDVVGAGLGGGDLDRLVGVRQIAGVVVDQGGRQHAEPDVEVVGVRVVDGGVQDDDQVLAGDRRHLVVLDVVGGLELAGLGDAVGQRGEGRAVVGDNGIAAAARGGAEQDVVGAGLGRGDLDRLVGIGRVALVVIVGGGGQRAVLDVELVGI